VRAIGAQNEGVKPTARVGFTPSGMAAGRRHSEAQGEFRPLRRAT